MKATYGAILSLTVLLAASGIATAARDTKWMENVEIFMAKDDFERLDPFEAQRLDEADRAFEDQHWRQARAAYDAFMLEFPKSHVIPYALMRKGRAIQRDNKMDEAFQTYNEVMDYFPNSVAYAAPTLFFMGECRASQQKWKAALDLWKEMAEDVDYSKHPFAAAAMNRLADGLYAQGEYADAGKFYLKSLTDFRRGDHRDVGHSIRQMLRIWVRDKPDVSALREACKAASGFEGKPEGKLTEDDQHFWDTVRAKIREYGGFEVGKESERDAYYEYWTKAMEGQMPKDDDFQKDLADFYLVLDGKREKWYARLDKQFEAYQKADDNDRIAKWMLFYNYDQQKLEEYFRKFDAANTRNETLAPLVTALFRVKEARPMSFLIFQKLKFASLPDSANGNNLSKGNLAASLYRSNEHQAGPLFKEAQPYVLHLYKVYGSQDLAFWDELGYWHYRAQQHFDAEAAEKGLPMADKCTKIPEYAKKAYYMKADMLLTLGRVDEAIAAYRATDDLPIILFRIAGLLVRQGKHAAAVSELSQVEGSGAFPREAPSAALEIANIWNGAGQKQLYIGALTTLIAKYPDTRESSSAHNALESMGLSHLIRGGKDAE